MDELGRKIRKLRKRRGLTLEETAKRAGCSPSFISQVERGKTTPSIASLKNITTALSINMAALFLKPKNHTPTVLQEPDRVDISMEGWHANIKSLVKDTKNKDMLPYYIRLEPGGGASDVMTHEGDEFGIVLKGELQINLGRATHKAKENESFYYSGRIPHGWINSGDEETIVIWVVSNPPSLE